MPVIEMQRKRTLSDRDQTFADSRTEQPAEITEQTADAGITL